MKKLLMGFVIGVLATLGGTLLMSNDKSLALKEQQTNLLSVSSPTSAVEAKNELDETLTRLGTYSAFVGEAVNGKDLPYEVISDTETETVIYSNGYESIPNQDTNLQNGRNLSNGWIRGLDW